MIQLYKGDCLIEMNKIADKSVDMILADLPYGTTACKWDKVIPFEPLWEQYKRVIKDNGAIVLFASQPFTSIIINSNIKDFKYEWIWNKKQGANFLVAKYRPLKIHESILVFNGSKYFPQMTKGRLRKRGGSKKQPELLNEYNHNFTNISDLYYPKSILEFHNCKRTDRLHPTQKPVALLEYLIKTYTNEGDTVLDNVMGSGSTGVACVNTNRNFIGIEMDEKYFQIAKDRIEQINNHIPTIEDFLSNK